MLEKTLFSENTKIYKSDKFLERVDSHFLTYSFRLFGWRTRGETRKLRSTFWLNPHYWVSKTRPLRSKSERPSRRLGKTLFPTIEQNIAADRTKEKIIMLSQLLLSLISCCVSIVHWSSRLHKRSHNFFFLKRGSPPPQPKVEGHSSRCLRHSYLLSKICQNMLINRERGESDQHVKSGGLYSRNSS